MTHINDSRVNNGNMAIEGLPIAEAILNNANN